MGYRDEDDAAAARIERLELELAEANAASGDADAIAALHREADELQARCKEIEAEQKAERARGPRPPGPPKRVWLGIALSIVPVMAPFLMPGDVGWVMFAPLLVVILGDALVLSALLERWRNGRAGRERAAREASPR